MKLLLALVNLSVLLFSCGNNETKQKRAISEQNEADTTQEIFKQFSDTIISFAPHVPLHELKDTLIQVSLLDLTPYSSNVAMQSKKELVSAAIRATRTEPEVYDFLQRPLSDFYLIDIDKDGDLDIIYSSLLDQYRNLDINSLLIIRNNGRSFKRYTIPGYLYYTDLFDKQGNVFLLRTVGRPCCDYFYYTLFETVFNPRTWTFIIRKVGRVEDNLVQEII